MRIVALGRRQGKTTKIVGWLKANPQAVLMVHSREEKDRIVKQYWAPSGEERKHFEDRIITPSNPNLRGRPRTVLGIDNLDLVLPQLIEGGHYFEIGPITMTGEIDV